MLTGLATGLPPARLPWVGGGGVRGARRTGGLDLSRRALCAAARLRHRCRNVGGLLRSRWGVRREADFLSRSQDDEEEVKNKTNGWI